MTLIDRDIDEPTGQSPRSVLNRAASLMAAFSGSDRVLSLNELSRRSGLPKSTAHRFAEQLLDLGWLEREVAGYRIGIRLFEIGSLAERRNKLRDKALSHLSRLAASTGYAVNLGILECNQVLYLDRMPVQGIALPSRDGGRMPPSCTALGKALLAFSSDEEVDGVIQAGLPRLTRRSIHEPSVLLGELDRIRARGVAFDVEEGCQGVSCVAAPVRNSGRAIGAVSVTVRSQDFDPDVLAPAVMRTAQAIWHERFPQREPTW